MQHAAQLRVEFAGVLRRFGLRVQVLRHGAVLLVHVHGHGPLAAVAHHIVQHVLEQTRVGRLALADQVRDVLQEVVDALELVEVHRIVLRELEFLDVHGLLGHIARHVERAEQPAAARAVLMGGLAVVERRGETTLQQAGTVVVARHLVDSCRGHGVHGHHIGLAAFEFAGEIIEIMAAQWADLVAHMLLCSTRLLRMLVIVLLAWYRLSATVLAYEKSRAE